MNWYRCITIGMAALLVGASLLALVLPGSDPAVVDLAGRLQPPLSDGHLLGTDLLGRDNLSRLLSGIRTSLLVAMAAAAFSAAAGTAIGVAAGYLGGRLDNLLMRGIDLLMAFPYLIFALVLVAVLGPGLRNALLAIAIVNIPFFARTVRGVVVSLSRRQFVEAGRVLGGGNLRIITRHILPNVLPTVIVAGTTTLAWMLLETAGLSFLGLGAQPPRADLGSMLAEGRKLMLVHPHVALLPGLAILVLAAGLNQFGDYLHERADPRRNRER